MRHYELPPPQPATAAPQPLGVAAVGTSAKYAKEDHVHLVPTALPPNGSAGGDLAGSYPNPTLAAFVSARVYRATDQTIGNASFTALSFSNEVHDAGGIWDAGAPTRLTVPAGKGGMYLLGCAFYFAANATGVRGCGIRIDGTTYKVYSVHQAPAGGAGYVTVQTALVLAATAYAEFLAYQDSTGDLAVTASSNISPVAWAVRLGA